MIKITHYLYNESTILYDIIAHNPTIKNNTQHFSWSDSSNSLGYILVNDK